MVEEGLLEEGAACQEQGVACQEQGAAYQEQGAAYQEKGAVGVWNHWVEREASFQQCVHYLEMLECLLGREPQLVIQNLKA